MRFSTLHSVHFHSCLLLHCVNYLPTAVDIGIWLFPVLTGIYNATQNILVHYGTCAHIIGYIQRKGIAGS